MPVLKTTSPVIVFSAPNPLPRRMVPSSRIREASFSELGTFDLEMEGSPIPNLKRLCPNKLTNTLLRTRTKMPGFWWRRSTFGRRMRGGRSLGTWGDSSDGFLLLHADGSFLGRMQHQFQQGFANLKGVTHRYHPQGPTVSVDDRKMSDSRLPHHLDRRRDALLRAGP